MQQKSDLKNETDVDSSQFAENNDLTNLKSEVDKLDNDTLAELDAYSLKPVPVDLTLKPLVFPKMYLLERVRSPGFL